MTENNLQKNAEFSLYGFLIERTAKRYKQVLQKLFQQHQFGITVDQWIILNKIEQEGKMHSNDLAVAVMKDAPTVTRILDILENKQLVNREVDAMDRRKTCLSLTQKGTSLVQQVKPIVVDMRREGWKGLNNQDLSDLERILNTIYVNVESLQQQPLALTEADIQRI
jgi:DNA-binding MarR family transcriptional regulator